MRAVVAGSGNVAESMAQALSDAGIEVVQIFARNEVRGRKVAALVGAQWCGRAGEVARADIYIIAVSDCAVAEVAEELPAVEGAVVAHTAGCVEMEALAPKHSRCAVIYPFMTFTAGRRVEWRNIPIFIEASDEATRRFVRDLASRLSQRVADADFGLRTKVHLAGVFANNFANAMFACATEVVERAGLDFGVLEAIIAQTAAKAVESGAPATVQTGPAVRGDSATLARHRKMLEEQAALRDIYDKISEYIWQTKTLRR